MPVVEINYPRLQKLIGKKTSRKKISNSLPFLGLDIESESKNDVRIEYSPNRPDFSTEYGIALGLQGLFGIKTGSFQINIKNKTNFIMAVDSSVGKIRPYVTGIVAKNGKIDDAFIRQMIVMQEDLHFGLGRKRKKSSIGIHDLDKISFPVRYTTVTKNHKFVPLTSKKAFSVSDILEKIDVGKEYGHVFSNSSKVPIIIDSKENTLSFPPIINSALTTVTSKTKNLFIEVTGINKTDVEDMLSIIATTLQGAGFELQRVKISGAKNSTPLFKAKKISIEEKTVNDLLGLNLSVSQIVTSLRKCRLDAVSKNKKIICNVPAYRFDILGPMDLVEEVALGYGIENLRPILSPSQTLGQKNPIINDLEELDQIMIGLGYMEAINSSLTSKTILYDFTNQNHSNMISVLDSKSKEHTVLRNSILPGLLENLSRNIHEPYPQKLFETGTVFSRGSPIVEEFHLACVSSHKDANFSEIKSVLQSMLQTGFNISCSTKTSSNPTFENGRTAKILAKNKTVGIVGEINNKTIENFKVRMPVVGFELKLSGLIFD